MEEGEDELFDLSLSSRLRPASLGGVAIGSEPAVPKIDHCLMIDPHRLVIGDMIGEGNSSSVHEALYQSMPVAVKLIDLKPERIEQCQERFQREVEMLSLVKHENIVEFIGASVSPNMLIVTELMKGGTLQKYLWSIRPVIPDLKLTINYALDISKVMEYLHAHHIIHRDLKPRNLLLTEDKKKIKLADFGLARELALEMSAEVGTYRWMAPEICSKDPLPKGAKKHYDHKVDVYSFSLILWELLTNKTPFNGKNNMMVAYAAAQNQRPSLENLPIEFVPLLQSCWSEDPANRPEFVEIIQILTAIRSTKTVPPNVIESEDEDKDDSKKDTGRLKGKDSKKSRKPFSHLCMCFSN